MKNSFKQSTIKTIWARARYFLALLKVKILHKNNPVICVIVVNNKCNFNCKYCFGDYYNRTIPDYTTKELKKLIDDLYSLGTRYLNIHGGETLLRNDIGEIVNYIKNKGMYCCLITNGSLLKQKIDEVRNVDNLTISLDGKRKNNDKNRGKGSFDIAIKAIELAVKEKLPLRISATITKHTMNDIGFMAKLAKKYKLSVHFSILFKPLSKAEDCEISNLEIRNSIKEIIKYKKMGYPVFTSEKVADYAINWPLDHNEYHYILEKDKNKLPKAFKHIECFYGKIKFTIDGDGKVYPCFLLGDENKFKALDWREVGIKKAIEHVQKNNTCITCPAMTQNDHNLLLGLDIKQISRLIYDQLKESIIGKLRF